MHYSGLLIQSDPDHVDACVEELAQCPGVEVFVTDHVTGRIVAVLETESLEEQESTLRQTQDLGYVLTAELVYHYFGDAQESGVPMEQEN